MACRERPNRPTSKSQSQWSCAGKTVNATNPSSSDARSGRCYYPSNSATSRTGGKFGFWGCAIALREEKVTEKVSGGGRRDV